jgi:hypothetical protein
MIKRNVAGLVLVPMTLMACGADREPLDAEIGSTKEQVVEGNDADKGEYPWIANIERKLTSGFVQDCTGSLIAPKWILTAAHCFNSDGVERDPSDMRITLGEHDTEVVDGDEQFIGEGFPIYIADYHPHPDYDHTANYNDVALIELSAEVEINEWVQTIALADGGDGDQPAIGAGWGALAGFGGEPAEILQEAHASIVSYEVCNAEIGPLPRPLTEDDICFGSGVTAVCHGDSGGPLIVERAPGCFEQVGISIFGEPNCGGYSAFARVPQYLPWIQSVVPGLGTTGVTYEAEAMEHTAGNEYEGGWNLHSTGYAWFTHSFDAGSTEMVVTAAAQLGFGPPNMRVTVAGDEVFNGPVSEEDWSDYPMTVTRPAAGNAEVRIYFTNDLYLPQDGVDRNLLLDKAVVLEEAEGCPTSTPEGDLDTSFMLESVWNEGYCARIYMTNPAAEPTTSWNATVDAGSGTVFKYWTPETLTSSSTVSFPSEFWNEVIAPGGTYGIAGFCVNHASGSYEPPVITVTAEY